MSDDTRSVSPSSSAPSAAASDRSSRTACSWPISRSRMTSMRRDSTSATWSAASSSTGARPPAGPSSAAASASDGSSWTSRSRKYLSVACVAAYASMRASVELRRSTAWYMDRLSSWAIVGRARSTPRTGFSARKSSGAAAPSASVSPRSSLSPEKSRSSATGGFPGKSEDIASFSSRSVCEGCARTSWRWPACASHSDTALTVISPAVSWPCVAPPRRSSSGESGRSQRPSAAVAASNDSRKRRIPWLRSVRGATRGAARLGS